MVLDMFFQRTTITYVGKYHCSDDPEPLCSLGRIMLVRNPRGRVN